MNLPRNSNFLLESANGSDFALTHLLSLTNTVNPLADSEPQGRKEKATITNGGTDLEVRDSRPKKNPKAALGVKLFVSCRFVVIKK